MQDRAAGQNMLMAIHDLVLNTTPRDPHQNQEEFWKALGAFVPEFLPGQFHIEIFDDGRVVTSYHPKK